MTAIIYSTAYLSEPGDIAAAPHDLDRCIIPFRLWNHDTMFIKLTTQSAKKFVLRVGGWHKCEEPYTNAIFVPYWIMANLQPINDGDDVAIRNIEHKLAGEINEIDVDAIYDEDELVIDEEPVLYAATKIKLRAHSRMFLDVDDPKAWLEGALQSMSVVTYPSSIPLSYMGQEFEFDIMTMEPNNRLRAGHLIDTDVEIDFEAPVDFVEPVRVPTPPVPVSSAPAAPYVWPATAPAQTVFSGIGQKLDETAAPPPDDPVAKRALILAAIARRNAAPS